MRFQIIEIHFNFSNNFFLCCWEGETGGKYFPTYVKYYFRISQINMPKHSWQLKVVLKLCCLLWGDIYGTSTIDQRWAYIGKGGVVDSEQVQGRDVHGSMSQLLDYHLHLWQNITNWSSDCFRQVCFWHILWSLFYTIHMRLFPASNFHIRCCVQWYDESFGARMFWSPS